MRMMDDDEFVTEVWEMFKPHLLPLVKLDIAVQFLQLLEEVGYSQEEVEELFLKDSLLKKAYKELYGEEEEE